MEYSMCASKVRRVIAAHREVELLLKKEETPSVQRLMSAHGLNAEEAGAVINEAVEALMLSRVIKLPG